MKRITIFGGAILTLSVLAMGCTETSAPPTAATTESAYRLDTEPDGALEVREAREAVGDEEPIVVTGRIGGDVNPWVEGLAAFSIVDNELPPCSEIPGDSCPTPWDYCCESNLAAARVLVKMTDDQGKLISVDARELLGVKELDRVVVAGTASRDEAGNVAILAKGVYVRPE